MPILENNTLWIREARLSFPHLVVAKAVNNGSPKFQASFLLQDSSQTWAEAMQIVGNVASEKWGAKAQTFLNVISADRKLRCYGNGSEAISSQTGEVYEGVVGS